MPFNNDKNAPNYKGKKMILFNFLLLKNSIETEELPPKCPDSSPDCSVDYSHYKSHFENVWKIYITSYSREKQKGK